MEFKLNTIKKISLMGLLALSALSTAYAGTVTSSQLNDNYVGADGRKKSTTDYTPNNITANYDTHWMKVSRITENGTTRLDVTIDSNFVSYNNSSSYRFGDLFMMDANDYTLADNCNDGTNRIGCNEYTEQTYSTNRNIYTKKSPNNWQYAFDLGGNRRNSYSDNTFINGNLREVDQNNYEYSIGSTDKNRDWQAIMVNDNAVSTVGNGGSWNTIISQNLLMMSFDITGTTLATADQIALRWAMTCANDIIEVVTDFASSGAKTSVPEPSTVLLMLAGLAGLYSKRKTMKS
jgi:hypothetical protein